MARTNTVAQDEDLEPQNQTKDLDLEEQDVLEASTKTAAMLPTELEGKPSLLTNILNPLSYRIYWLKLPKTLRLLLILDILRNKMYLKIILRMN